MTEVFSCPCCLEPVSGPAPSDGARITCSRCRHAWWPAATHEVQGHYAQQQHRTDRRRDHVERKWSERLAWVLPHVTPTTRLLDVGCAEGEFGARVRASVGALVHGVEPSRDAEAAAERLDAVHHGPLHTAPSRRYDLIVSFHVMEHVADLDGFLGDVDRRLAPGGTLFLEVPHEAGHPWLDHDPNVEHLHCFTASSLVSLLERSGWTIQALTAGGFESPMYADSLRVVARRRAPAGSGRRHRLAALAALAADTGVIVYGLGGDFRGYVRDLVDGIDVVAYLDRNATPPPDLDLGAPVLPPDAVRDLPAAAPILIATYRFEPEVRRQLIDLGVSADRLHGLDLLFPSDAALRAPPRT